MRFVVSFSIVVLSSVIFAAEPRIHRDLAYFEPKEQHRTLDVEDATTDPARPQTTRFNRPTSRNRSDCYPHMRADNADEDCCNCFGVGTR